MEPEPSIPDPPADAETTVTRQTWTEPSPDGGPPTSFERTVTTTTWSTTTETFVDAGDATSFAFPEATAEESITTSTTHDRQLDAPRLPSSEPTAPHLPGVPPAGTSRVGSWLHRLRGR